MKKKKGQSPRTQGRTSRNYAAAFGEEGAGKGSTSRLHLVLGKKKEVVRSSLLKKEEDEPPRSLRRE